MRKLPFKVEPKVKTVLVGNEETGTLEFPVLGGLKVGEQVAVDEVARSFPSAYTEASRLAVRIDAELNLDDLLFAFNIVATPDWEGEERQEIEASELTQKEKQKRSSELEAKTKIFRSARIRYAPDILNLNSNIQKSGYSRQLTAVTAVLQHRIDDSWTEADTEGLSDALFQLIWEFVQSEMGGKTEASKPSEEEVGKPLEENSTLPNSTGLTSTGESSDSGLPTSDSAL